MSPLKDLDSLFILVRSFWQVFKEYLCTARVHILIAMLISYYQLFQLHDPELQVIIELRQSFPIFNYNYYSCSYAK